MNDVTPKRLKPSTAPAVIVSIITILLAGCSSSPPKPEPISAAVQRNVPPPPTDESIRHHARVRVEYQPPLTFNAVSLPLPRRDQEPCTGWAGACTANSFYAKLSNNNKPLKTSFTASATCTHQTKRHRNNYRSYFADKTNTAKVCTIR